jgi:serine/threonine protein kinase
MQSFDEYAETPIEMNRKANTIIQEAATLSVFDHENIIKFYNSFREENSFYIVTEYCEVSLTISIWFAFINILFKNK